MLETAALPFRQPAFVPDRDRRPAKNPAKSAAVLGHPKRYARHYQDGLLARLGF